MFLIVNVKDEDIELIWVGICLLIFEKGKDFFEILCKDEVWEGEFGLLIIVGGKLIGYCYMVLEIVDLLVKCLK